MLTTQLFFPADAGMNDQDDFFDDSLVIDIRQNADGNLIGRFDFVLISA